MKRVFDRAMFSAPSDVNVRISTNLILRSRVQRGVSKDGQQHDWLPPFETRALRAPQGEAL